MKPTTFAIDFDNTIDRDPILWRAWVDLAILRGHKVYLVTSRRDTMENQDIVYEWLKDNNINLAAFFTSLRSKIEYMEERRIKIDVWVDDSPMTLVNGH